MLLACTACIASSSTGLFPVLPIIVLQRTHIGGQAGLVTGAIAAATVMLELQNHQLLQRFGPARAILIGFALADVGMLGMATLPPVWLMAAMGVIFGAGFGIIVASTTAAVQSVARPETQGLALGLYGVVATVPLIGAPPITLTILANVGPRPVFALLIVSCVLGTIAASSLNLRRVGAQTAGLTGTLLRPRLLLLFSTYMLVSITFGCVLSYSAFVVHGAGLASLSAFFLAFGATRVAARGLSGILLDRLDEAWIAAPALLVATIGLAMLPGGGLWSFFAAVVYGLGFGSVQSFALVSMLKRATKQEAAAAAGLWNFAVDGGVGLGALALAPLATLQGYTVVFMWLPTLVLLALCLWAFDWIVVSRGVLGAQ